MSESETESEKTESEEEEEVVMSNSPQKKGNDWAEERMNYLENELRNLSKRYVRIFAFVLTQIFNKISTFIKCIRVVALHI